ncbi:F-box protein SKIP16-like [Phragmites australis]|uniref:F-box protein SKIP16-like n=1 Tax=Phragmites australis TaxID=29695 RepID=UPI002D7A2C92|nr:F-box protein SKIP16-like [Phragmites australis]
MALPPLTPHEPTAAATAGLESLEGLVLDTVISKAGARPAAALACASTRLRAAVAEDSLWRRFCAEDLGLDAPLDPEDRPLPSFKDAYKVWLESFGMYPLPLVKRVKKFWSSLKTWLSVNFPEAFKTLCKGVSESQLKLAEDDLGFKLPMPMKLLYRFCNAQLPFSENHDVNEHISTYGIIGGYAFYDHWVNVHLSPLEQIVEETKLLYREYNEVFSGRKLIVVATSWFHPKTFLLNCSNGELHVGTSNLPLGEMFPCVPKSLIRPTDNDMPQDGLLLWLEEHLRRLQHGMIKTRMLMTSRYISLYPEAPPSCTSAMTNGVKVRASAVFVPEHPGSGEPRGRYMYSYSIRLSVPEACMLGGVYYSSCQLYSRHWIIGSRDGVVSDVHGEGVIGEYPVLSPGQEEFVYESCTPLPKGPGYVEGSFSFVPGKLSRPEGKPFEVSVAPFPLEVPEYIF